MLRQRHSISEASTIAPKPSPPESQNTNTKILSSSSAAIHKHDPADFITVDVIAGVFLGAIVLTAYAFTLYPTIPGGDSGELVAEACTLGHSHPPGYPLFTMLYHAAFRAWDLVLNQNSGVNMYLPTSLATWTIAQQANLVTAIIGSLAAVFLFRFTQLLCWSSMSTSSPWTIRICSFTSSALFAFSPLVWQYSVGSEVFALNNLLISILLLVTAQFARFPTNTNASIGAFVCGLAMCNQHTAVLFEAPLIVWVLWIKRNDVKENPWLALQWGIWFLIGLLPYMYLPWSSIFNKQHGSWGDSSTVIGFIHHLRRGDYGTFQLFSKNKADAAGPYERTMMYASDFSTQQAPSLVAVFLGAFGVLLTRVAGIRAFMTKLFCFTTSSPIDSSVSVSKRNQHQGMSTSKTRGLATKKSGNTDTISEALAETGHFRPRPEMLFVHKMKQNDSLGIAIVFAFTTYIFIFHLLSNIPLDEALLAGVQARFWMQPNMIAFAWVGVGLVGCSNILAKGNLNSPKRFVSTSSEHTIPQTMVSKKNRGNKVKKGRADNVPPPPVNLVMIDITEEPEASYTLRNISAFLLIFLVCITLISLQVLHNWERSNQSSNNYLESYGMALLTSLPPKSVLLINYDQQWTTVRYLQRCMNVRPDIVAINLSMMSFQWFPSYHHTYPTLSFPGTHMSASLGGQRFQEMDKRVGSKAMDMSFTFAQFLDSNIGNADCCAGGIYMGGNVPQNDKGYMAKYETKFVGLLTRFYHKTKERNNENSNGSTLTLSVSPAFNEWFTQASQAWREINTLVSHVPDTKYGADTWEWTVNRDRYEKLAAFGSEVLFEGVERSDHGLIVLASSVLEACWQGDGDEYVSVGTLKNLGLAYVKLVQSKKDATESELAANVMLKEAVRGQYREVASVRAYEAWSKFLTMKGAKKDSGFAHIQNVVKVLKNAKKVKQD